MLVENRPGAGGNIGMAYVARAKADGYTLGLGTIGTQSINPFLYANMTFDPARDFVPIALVSTTPNVIAVSARSPHRTVADIIQAARRNPERKLTHASPGVGSSVHLTGAYFEAMAGISMLHVPFKGTSASLPAVAGGQVDLLFDNLPGALAQIQNGGLVRGVAVTSAARDPSAPALPTVAESGLPGFDVTAWFALYAPRDTPEPVVRQLIEAAREGCARPIWPRASPRRAPSPARCSALNWPRSSRTSAANGAGWSRTRASPRNEKRHRFGHWRQPGHRPRHRRAADRGWLRSRQFQPGRARVPVAGRDLPLGGPGRRAGGGRGRARTGRVAPVLHLVNNAGMIEVAGIEAVTQDALARTMAVNLVAPVVLLQALLPGMRAARHGRVVNIGSRAALGKPTRVQGRAGGHDADLGAGTGGRRHHGEHRGAGAGGDGTVQRVESPAIRARARWRPRSRWGAAACRKRWRTWWPCSWTGAPPS